MVEDSLDREKLPRHIAIIMDGNGRWAKRHSLKRVLGHQKGMDSVRAVVETCRELKIDVLTLYAFSAENWRRPKTEVQALMALLKRYCPGLFGFLKDTVGNGQTTNQRKMEVVS